MAAQMRFNAMGAAAMGQGGREQGVGGRKWSLLTPNDGASSSGAGGAGGRVSPNVTGGGAPQAKKVSKPVPGKVFAMRSGEQVSLEDAATRVGWRKLDGVYHYRGQLGGRVGTVPDGIGSLRLEIGDLPFAIHCHWEKGRVVENKAAKIEYDNGDAYFGAVGVEEEPAADPVPAEDFSFLAYVQSHTIIRKGRGEFKANGRNSVRYYGFWRGNARHGFGIQLYPDGGKYYGDWEQDSRHGQGCYLDPDGSLFEGAWRRDERSGEGTLFLPNGTSMSGKWKDEVLDGKSRCEQRAFAPSLWAKTQAATAGCLEFSVNRLSSSGRGGSGEQSQTISPLRWQHCCPLNSSMYDEEYRNQNSGTGAKSTGLFRAIVGKYIQTHHPRALDNVPTSVTLDQLISFLRPADYSALRPKLESALSRWIADALRRDTVLSKLSTSFCRYFWFMYGTCGSSDEIGAGPNFKKYECGFLGAQCGVKPLKPSIPLKSREMSFCHNYDHFAGCIHRGAATPIATQHLYNAHDDILSFSIRLRNAAERCLRPALADLLRKCGLSLSGTAMCAPLNQMNEMIVSRVYAVLRNLYSSAFAEDDTKIYRKLQSLKNVTLDDIGATFARDPETEKIFPPYSDSIKDLAALPKCASVAKKLKQLRTIAEEIDNHTAVVLMKQSAAKGAAKRQEKANAARNEYEEVMANHRKRANSVMPGKQQADVKVAEVEEGEADGEPGEDGVHPHDVDAGDVDEAAALAASESFVHHDDNRSVAAMNFSTTMSIRARSQSAATDAPPTPPLSMTPPPGSKQQIVGDVKKMSAAFFFQVNMSTDGTQDAKGVEGGAADDLFPINLYIFIKSCISAPLSELTFLLDFTSYTFLFDSSPDDGYRLATFQACMSYVLELDWSTRDAQKVLIPKSVLENRFKETTNSVVTQIRSKRRDLIAVQAYCPHLSLMEYLPPLAWIEDFLLATAAVDIDQFVVYNGKRLLPIESKDLPQGFARYFNTILKSVGMELVVAADCQNKDDYDAFLAAASQWLKDVERNSAAAHGVYPPGASDASLINTSLSPPCSPVLRVAYKRSTDNLAGDGRPRVDSTMSAVTAVTTASPTGGGPPQFDMSASAALAQFPARYPCRVFIEVEQYHGWAAGQKERGRALRRCFASSPRLSTSSHRSDVRAAAAEALHASERVDSGAAVSPRSLPSHMSAADLPTAASGSGVDDAVGGGPAGGDSTVGAEGASATHSDPDAALYPADDPAAAGGGGSAQHSPTSSSSSSDSDSSSDDDWTAMKSRFGDVGRGAAKSGSGRARAGTASMRVPAGSRGQMGAQAVEDIPTYGLRMYVFFKEYYHANLYQLLATCLSHPDG